MSVGLIVTGGYGNGTLAGSVGGVALGGYLPAIIIPLSFANTKSQNTSAPANLLVGSGLGVTGTSNGSVSGGVLLDQHHALPIGGSRTGNASSPIELFQNRVVSLVGSINQCFSEGVDLSAITSVEWVDTISGNICELVAINSDQLIEFIKSVNGSTSDEIVITQYNSEGCVLTTVYGELSIVLDMNDYNVEIEGCYDI